MLTIISYDFQIVQQLLYLYVQFVIILSHKMHYHVNI